MSRRSRSKKADRAAIVIAANLASGGPRDQASKANMRDQLGVAKSKPRGTRRGKALSEQILSEEVRRRG